MRTKKRLAMLAFTTIVATLVASCASDVSMRVSPEYSSEQRLRVAVLSFEYVAGDTQTSALWGSAWMPNAGATAADLLTAELMEVPSLVVVERSRIKAILDERKLTEAGLLSSGQLEDVSSLAGVDAFIMGTVSEAGSAGVLGISRSSAAFTARCIRAKDGVVLWSATTSASSSSPTAQVPLQKAVEQLGDEIAEKLR
jgi:curli biogenesis system outer membrane secretion channel CsgG